MIKHMIAGPSGLPTAVVDGVEPNSLVVATRPLKEFNSTTIFFTNETHGAALNVDATAGGNADEIHDGTDNPYWTGSTISGTWTFDDATYNHTGGGAKSVDASATTGGDEALFTRGVPMDISGYVSLSGWIYITKWGATGTKHVEVRARLAGVNVGTAVNIDDYVDTGTLGAWLKFVIPKGALGLGTQTIDELVVHTVNAGGVSPDYYLDDLQWEETGSPLIYYVRPAHDTLLYVTKMNIFYADAYTGIITVAGATENATMPSIPYDGFLNVSALSAGVVYQRHAGSKVLVSFPIKQQGDLMSFNGAAMTGYGSDGVNSWVSTMVAYDTPIILRPENDDYMSLTLSDDLSGLLDLKVSIGGYVEQR